MDKHRLYDIAKIIRSKNSGPFEITIDILFDNPKSYELVKKSGMITVELVSTLYKIPVGMVKSIIFFGPALGLKITYARKISSGTCLDTDVYGAQQHAPLMDLMF